MSYINAGLRECRPLVFNSQVSRTAETRLCIRVAATFKYLSSFLFLLVSFQIMFVKKPTECPLHHISSFMQLLYVAETLKTR